MTNKKKNEWKLANLEAKRAECDLTNNQRNPLEAFSFVKEHPSTRILLNLQRTHEGKRAHRDRPTDICSTFCARTTATCHHRTKKEKRYSTNLPGFALGRCLASPFLPRHGPDNQKVSRDVNHKPLSALFRLPQQPAACNQFGSRMTAERLLFIF